jgi:hypothetical protein
MSLLDIHKMLSKGKSMLHSWRAVLSRDAHCQHEKVNDVTTETSSPIDLRTMKIDAEAWLEAPAKEFCEAVVNKKLRRDMIRLLQKRLPQLTEDEADLAIVDAAIRCLITGDYLRFDPRAFSLKGGFGLIALSCAEHLLRPFMIPHPTATKRIRKVRVKFVGLPSEEGDRHIPAPFQVPDVADGVLRHEWVQHGLSCLNEPERMAIRAYFWDELRGAELAAALGVSEDHAKKPVSRAIRRLCHTLVVLASES